MSSCFGFRRSTAQDREPLLPQYHDDTQRQHELHKKLHSYQILRALRKGFMPSNEQLIVNLRTLLAADVLNPQSQDLSQSGRLLIQRTKRLLQQFMDLLQHKNSEDQIQDFLWFLPKANLSLDAGDISRQASTARARADTAAAYQSLHTVGSLLLTNSDFRIFVSDLTTVGREVFRDTAFSLSGVAEEAGRRLDPPKDEQDALKFPGEDARHSPSGDDVTREVAEVSHEVQTGAVHVVQEAKDSLADKLHGGEKDTLVHRLKQAVASLRKRPDYDDSVSTIAMLLKRYVLVYTRALEDTVSTAESDVHVNSEMELAMKNFWSFLISFGDRHEWQKLEEKAKHVIDQTKHDPEFEGLLVDVGNSLEGLLKDPEFFDHIEERFQELRVKSEKAGKQSSLRQEVEELLHQISITFQSVVRDDDISKLLQTALSVVHLFSPQGEYVNDALLSDSLSVFIPLVIQAVQYVPIPRLEVSTPEIDLLLENLILEPGKTINHTSFLPYKLDLNTVNNVTVRAAHVHTVSTVTTSITVTLSGLTLCASELGFWFRLHKFPLFLTSSGLANFALDNRGLDLSFTIDIPRGPGLSRPDSIARLRAARAHVHQLDYSLKQSKLSPLLWLLKPILRPLLKKTLEWRIANAVADGLRALDREFVFARERLRATRVAEPRDLVTFLRAVAARWTPEEDPEVYTRVGVDEPGAGVFRGRYAPGSLVKLWKEEAGEAAVKTEEITEFPYDIAFCVLKHPPGADYGVWLR
ncbi:hypothetical protein P152DRAFT_470337 [Eremomyces bilateralis CBS 781.70]|uniref:HAM1-like N-terminal domain-containing protein n=1 Tax=Eremomyces bilateralis CBS 781.70 TaxID=1392243 RepID=A0A6G1GEH6_9PEZI|nr:uncharacterized protein P152DRAFT_470337 [Eremomyces bilateralis CBS 781.70]KAF1816301.1 hypothetical protein P152DRAFT_470337 [Eremomyces bilateralis CBS 781.70]